MRSRRSPLFVRLQENQAQIAAFFGDELKPLKGNIWSRGGLLHDTVHIRDADAFYRYT